jgi:AcrR family transcriptional regulator
MSSISPWPAARSRQRSHSARREAVVRVAAREFNRRGFHNTSLDDIAAALNVSKPTIYYYVANKEQLLFECFRAGLEPIRAAFEEVAGRDAPARERLAEVLRRYAAAIASEYGWCMVRAEDQDLGEGLRRHINALKSEIDQGIRQLLVAGMRDGSIAPCDPKMTAFAFAGALNWIAHWYRDNQPLTPGDIGDAFVALFERGIAPRAGAVPAKPPRDSAPPKRRAATGRR